MPTYEQVTYMRQVIDMGNNKKYYVLGRVTQPSKVDTLAVTEKGGNGGTVFFCEKHQRAYGLREECSECATQVVDMPTEASVTSCDTR